MLGLALGRLGDLESGNVNFGWDEKNKKSGGPDWKLTGGVESSVTE